MSDDSGAKAAAPIKPIYGKMQNLLDRRSAGVHAAYLVPHIKPDMRILDVGCGTGSITFGFADLVPQGAVVGVDISEDMLKHAQAAKEAKGATNVELVKGNAMDLNQFQDESFDVVHAHQVILHLPDPVKALREMHRVLRPGGLLASRDSAEVKWYPMSKGLELSRQIAAKLITSGGGNMEGGMYTHAWAHEAGFEWGKIEHSAAGWTMATREEVKVFAFEAARQMSQAALKTGFANEEEVAMMDEDWGKWAERDDSWIAAVDGQILCKK